MKDNYDKSVHHETSPLNFFFLFGSMNKSSTHVLLFQTEINKYLSNDNVALGVSRHSASSM